MLTRLDRIATDSLSALHREKISNPVEVLAVLERAARLGSVLDAGIDRRNEPRRATIISIGADSMLLSASGFGDCAGRQLFFQFEIETVRYFLACIASSYELNGLLRAVLPRAIYRADRRDLGRDPSSKHAFIMVDGAPGEPRAV